MWDAAHESGNALLRAAVECETNLCRARRRCWLKDWLRVLQCGLGDIATGQLGSKVEEACVRDWNLTGIVKLPSLQMIA